METQPRTRHEAVAELIAGAASPAAIDRTCRADGWLGIARREIALECLNWINPSPSPG